jgi:tRNA(fMet)-specific endonuclease VapC
MTPRYLLDTNIVSDLIRHPQGSIAKHIARVGEARVFTSIIVAAELRTGAARRASARLSAQVEAVLGAIEILPLDVPADATYGTIRAELESQGQPIGGNDLLIAAQALSQGAVMVTGNHDEFSRIAGLPVENWLQRPQYKG